MEQLDDEHLRKVFRTLDLDGDGSLNAQELLKAFEKTGSRPTLTEVYAMIAQVDTNGDKAVSFEEFKDMAEKIKTHQIPATTGLPQLIKSVWEDYIAQLNKPLEKNKITVVKTATKYLDEAPQGQKYKLGQKKKGYRAGSLPPKKSFSDLP